MRKLWLWMMLLGALALRLPGDERLLELARPDPPAWLTGTTWEAGIEIPEYLQRLTFGPHRDGERIWGDNQVIRIHDAFRYDVTPGAGDTFRLQVSDVRPIGQQASSVEFRRLRGRFTFPLPGGDQATYAECLEFTTCPFEVGLPLRYYGHRL